MRETKQTIVNVRLTESFLRMDKALFDQTRQPHIEEELKAFIKSIVSPFHR